MIDCNRARSKFFISWTYLLSFLFLASVAGLPSAAQALTAMRQEEKGRTLPIQKAVQKLSQDLKARIIIFGNLEDAQVVLPAAHHEALDQLKSILKGYSFAIVYNDPTHAYDCYGSPASGSAAALSIQTQSSVSDRTIESIVDELQPERLIKRIEQVEAQIENGEADAFFERWSEVKDPRYIYNHRAQLEQLRRKMAQVE